MASTWRSQRKQKEEEEEEKNRISPVNRNGLEQYFSPQDNASSTTHIININALNQANRKSEICVIKWTGITVLGIISFLLFFAFVNQDIHLFIKQTTMASLINPRTIWKGVSEPHLFAFVTEVTQTCPAYVTFTPVPTCGYAGSNSHVTYLRSDVFLRQFVYLQAVK